MAEFTGITAARADEILGMSVVSGTINEAGHLILTREDGSSIDAGDFTDIITDILTDTVNAAVAAQVPNYVAGTTVSFSEFNSVNLVNAMIRARLIGNITINTSSLPSSPKPNTQFAMRLQQDGSGFRTLTLTGFKKSQGVLSLSTGANAIDIVIFIFDGVQWYAGLMGVDFQ
jgi:hypothetical protein